MKNNDFKLLRGFADWQTNEQTFVIVESLSRLKSVSKPQSYMYSIFVTKHATKTISLKIDFKIFGGFWFMDICDCRVAFATDKPQNISIMSFAHFFELNTKVAQARLLWNCLFSVARLAINVWTMIVQGVRILTNVRLLTMEAVLSCVSTLTEVAR